jgi:hypothetical protein
VPALKKYKKKFAKKECVEKSFVFFQSKSKCSRKMAGKQQGCEECQENEYYGYEESLDRNKDRMIETGKWSRLVN